MKSKDTDTARRRLKLRVAAKLMIYVGFAGVLYVFFAAFRSGDGKIPSLPGMRVSIAHIQPGEADFFSWEGRPVVVYRRLQTDASMLRSDDKRLLDASSMNSEQPESSINAWRSETPEWFVALALGTDLGCSIALLPASNELFQGQVWSGGFVDSCRKARYDLAGRVYKSQYAERNLIVPRYGIVDDTLILGR